MVDDSRSVRRAVEASLQPLGFEVELAENGATALARLRAAPYDLVFLDINMPVLDGPGLLRMLRSLGISVRTVLITSGAAKPAIASSIKFGAEEYVSKPFTPQKIREVAARVLGLDLRTLPLYLPRVLLYFTDKDLASRLRDSLPEHVHLDSVALLGDAIELASKSQYDLVLIDAQVQEGADVLRTDQTDAAIMAVSRDPASPPYVFAPEGSVDGVVSSRLDDAVVQDFLYQNFIRPLAFVEAGTIRAAGFKGDPTHLAAYFAQLERVLCARAAREAAVMPDVSIDLRRVPADAGRLAHLIGALCMHLDILGAAPGFTISDEQRAAVGGRPEVATALLLSGPPT